MIHDLKPYPAMKDSGVPWLGQVPEHWVVQPALAVYKPREVKNTGLVEKTVLSLSYGRIVIKPEEKLRGLVPESFETYQIVEPGNIIVRTTDLQNDRNSLRIGHSRNRGVITSAYLCLETTGSVLNEFGYQYLNAYDLLKIIYGYGSGLRQSLSFNDIRRMPVLVPPPAEQAAIVRFLDHADRRIRKAIAAKQKLIRLLQEQKQVIIHQAVTRGLDPNVKLKPSGVEWLGDVPEGWEIAQLRRLVRRGKKITYGIVQAGEPDPSGRFMIRGQDYSFGWVLPEKIFRVSRAAETPYRRSRLRKGDLLMTIVGAGVGNMASVPEWLDGANITQTTARISIDPLKSYPEFVETSLSGYMGRKNVELYVKGAAQPGLNLEHVRIFLIAIPPLDEQREIVAALEGRIRKTNDAVTRAQQEISLLREYRARLIADVVTGKLDVRDAAARLPELADEAIPEEPDTEDPEAREDEEEALVAEEA